MWKYFFDHLNDIDIDKQENILAKRIHLIIDNTHEWMYYSWFKDDLNIYLRFIQDDLDVEVRDFREASQRLIEAWILDNKPFDNSKTNWVIISIIERTNNLLKDNSK